MSLKEDFIRTLQETGQLDNHTWPACSKKRIDVAKQVRELRAIAMGDIENVEPGSPEYQLFAETLALCDRYLNSLPSEHGS